eukprot:269858-Rhodomonas_salina.1
MLCHTPISVPRCVVTVEAPYPSLVPNMLNHTLSQFQIALPYPTSYQASRTQTQSVPFASSVPDIAYGLGRYLLRTLCQRSLALHPIRYLTTGHPVAVP